jgi:hypothetical protein
MRIADILPFAWRRLLLARGGVRWGWVNCRRIRPILTPALSLKEWVKKSKEGNND